jgi:hypothetical protein
MTDQEFSHKCRLMNSQHIDELDAKVDGISIKDVYDIRIDDAGVYLEIMSQRGRQTVIRISSSTCAEIVWDSNDTGAVLVFESLFDGSPMAFVNSHLLKFSSVRDACSYARNSYPAGRDGADGTVNLLTELPCISCGPNRLPRCIYDESTSAIAFIGAMRLEGGANPYQFLGVVLFDLNAMQIRRAYQFFSDRTDGMDWFVLHRLDGSYGKCAIGISHVVEEHDLYVVDMESGHTEFLSSAFSNEGGGLAIASLRPEGAVIMPSNSFHGNLRVPTLFTGDIGLGKGIPLEGLPDLGICSASDVEFSEVIDRFMYDGAFADEEGQFLLSWNCDFGISVFDLTAVRERNTVILLGVRSFERKILGASGWREWVVVAEDEMGLRLRSYRNAELAQSEPGTVTQFRSRYGARCAD